MVVTKMKCPAVLLMPRIYLFIPHRDLISECTSWTVFDVVWCTLPSYVLNVDRQHAFVVEGEGKHNELPN